MPGRLDRASASRRGAGTRPPRPSHRDPVPAARTGPARRRRARPVRGRPAPGARRGGPGRRPDRSPPPKHGVPLAAPRATRRGRPPNAPTDGESAPRWRTRSARPPSPGWRPPPVRRAAGPPAIPVPDPRPDRRPRHATAGGCRPAIRRSADGRPPGSGSSARTRPAAGSCLPGLPPNGRVATRVMRADCPSPHPGLAHGPVRPTAFAPPRPAAHGRARPKARRRRDRAARAVRQRAPERRSPAGRARPSSAGRRTPAPGWTPGP